MSDSPKVTVALDPDDYEVLTDVADEEDRTIAAQARRVLREWARDTREDRARGEA